MLVWLVFTRIHSKCVHLTFMNKIKEWRFWSWNIKQKRDDTFRQKYFIVASEQNFQTGVVFRDDGTFERWYQTFSSLISDRMDPSSGHDVLQDALTNQLLTFPPRQEVLRTERWMFRWRLPVRLTKLLINQHVRQAELKNYRLKDRNKASTQKLTKNTLKYNKEVLKWLTTVYKVMKQWCKKQIKQYSSKSLRVSDV